MNRLASQSLRAFSLAFGVALCFVALSSRVHAAQDGVPRVAWVVGNAHYVGMTGLNNPLHDAQDICQALQRLRFTTFCHADVPDRAQLLQRFAAFTAQLTPETHALIYYAGHAVQIQGHNYLVPTHALVKAVADVPRELVDVQELLDEVGRKGNAFTMVTLDACRDDPFADTAAASDRIPANLLRQVGPRQPGREGPVSYGLGAIRDAPRGAIILYATGSNDVALDGSGRNGLLTKHLLAHIETPGITVENLIKRVGIGVQKESGRSTRRQQTPFVYSSFTGEFCFAQCQAAPQASEPGQLKARDPRLEEQLRQSVPAASPPAPGPRPIMPATF